MEVSEGGVTLQVPETATNGKGDAVFYNPNQEGNRDVTVAALRTLQARKPSLDSYLDAMTASGVRGVRAADAGWSVTCCDRDPDAVELCRDNLARNGLEADVRHADANVAMHRDVFDVVDLDPFGSPIPFADAAFVGTGQVLCVTATDTAPLCGAHFRAGIRRYGAIARNTEYHQEMGLRVLLSALCRTAARYDIGIDPLLSQVEGHYVRTYLSLSRGATVADGSVDKLGTLRHCPECLYRETERGLLTTTRERCPHCGSDQLLAAGPLWLGPTHDAVFVQDVIGNLDDAMGTARRSGRMLDRLAAELHIPTHYDQHRLCDRWDRSAGPMDAFLEAIRAAGHETSRTHYGGTTFKTTADVGTIRDVTSSDG